MSQEKSGRNAFDVALELTRLHVDKFAIDENEIEKLYAKYFAIAGYLGRCSPDRVEGLIPEEILSKITK